MTTAIRRRIVFIAVLLSLAGCSSKTSSESGTAAPPPPAVCHIHGALPDAGCTPGALNPAVIITTERSTICKKGWTSTIRPSVTESSRLKRLVASRYGITASLTNYEGDHLISLELGGAPDDVANFWDEPHHVPGPAGVDNGSFTKDAFENWLNREVCSGRLALAVAQHEIAGDWLSAYTAAGRPPDPYHHTGG